jgi:colicin import membrane protein
MSTTSSLRLRLPRERGTGRAFALAVTLHVALLALVFVGTRGAQNASIGSDTVFTGSVAPLPPAAPVPRTPSREWASGVVAVPALVFANDPTPLARHRNNAVKPQRLHRLDSRAIRAEAGPRASAFEAVAIAQQSMSPMEQARAAHLVALQDIAGRSLMDSGGAASAGYAGKVARRVHANVLAPFDIEGNPSAVIAVTCTPSGALLSVTVQRSSGNPQWDRAAVTAVENSFPIPADVNGSTPTSFVLTFRPKG